MYFKSDNKNINIRYNDDDSKNKKIKYNAKGMKPFIIFGIIILGCIILYIIADITEKNNNDSSDGNNNTIVKDNTHYYINLNGDNTVNIYTGEKYIEAGYKGFDNKGNDLTRDVIVNDLVDYNKAGYYKITYTLKETTVERTIIVTDKPIGATYIHLLGNSNVYINVGENYVEPGFEVIDSIDGNKLKKYVKVTNNINNTKGGIYQVTYTVTNSSGITTSKVRNIIVMDSEISLTLDNSNYTNGKVGINVFVNDMYFDYLLLPDNTRVSEKKYTYYVSQNGTYKFTAYNKRGGGWKKSITVSNINKTKPNGTCSGSYQNGVSTISVKASDDIGIKKYVIDNVTYTKNTIKINKEIHNVNITIYDKAGNTNNISCVLEDKNIKYKQQFTLLSYTHPGGYTFNYWLTVPKNAKDNMPLIIFLHGDGYENKPEELGNFFIVGKSKTYNNGNPGFIFIAPNTQEKSWVNGTIPSSLKGLIDKTVNDFKINKSRIYIIGYSRGAIGTWNIVNKYPYLFAAAVPISCGPNGGNDAANFKHTKIRAISGNSGGDEANYNSQMTSFVNQINAQGGSAEKITYSGYKHTNIFKAFDIDEVFQWLLSQ